MQLATTAPSGNVGRHVLRDLVRGGVVPRVLAHRPESLDAALVNQVDLRVVDLHDEPGLTAALQGVDSLFVTVPAVLSEDPLADYDRFGTTIARAVAACGVERVVLQSSGGAELRHGAGEIDGLARVEELLDATDASTLHLRCGFFFTNLVLQIDQVEAGEMVTVLPTDQPVPWVAPVDIAHVAASWLLRADWSGRHVRGVHGPADLSWDQAVDIVARATGRPLTVRRIGDDEMRAVLSGTGMSDNQVEAVLGMSTGLRDGFVPEQPRDVTTTTGTTLASWSYDVLRPLLDERAET